MKWHGTTGFWQAAPEPDPRQRSRQRRRARRAGAAALLAVGLATVPTFAQPIELTEPVPTPPALINPPAASDETSPSSQTPQFATPVADWASTKPIVASNAVLKAQRAWTWQDGPAQMLLLEGEVEVAVGVYGFRAARAVVRLDREPQPGRAIHHLAIYLDQVRPLLDGGLTQVEADRLLVTASTTGQVHLETDLRRAVARADDPLAQEAQARLAEHARALATARLDLPPAALAEDPEAVHPGRAPSPPLALQGQSPAPAPPLTKVLPARGLVSLNFDRSVAGGEGALQNAVTLMGDVRLMYYLPGENEGITLEAGNAVVFVDPEQRDQLLGGQVDASAIQGIYLEENVVISNGQYTLRAPRVFYDLALNKAIVLNAVLYTYDVRREVPLYMRAEKLMQVARNSWRAEGALVTTSEFAKPHFSIASERVTLTEEATEGGTRRKFLATDNTLRIGDVPVFYWPRLAGEDQATPLRNFSVDYNSDNGPEVRTAWDLFALIGRSAPEGVELDGLVDFRGEHGLGVGFDLDYGGEDMFGAMRGYVLPIDHGDDNIADRRDIEFDGDFRGFVSGYHRQVLRDNWELSLQRSIVSDETFLEEFFRAEAYEARQYETSVYLKKQEPSWALTLLGQFEVNDFVTQLTTLQAPGYTVDRVPEVAFHQIGVPLWDDRLTYFGESRVSRMRLRFGEDAPEDRGFTNAQSLRAFGIPTAAKFEAARPLGPLANDWVSRFDTRHEIQIPMKVGTVDVVPYATGRVTAYDQDFEEVAGTDDRTRLYGRMGVRLHTQFHRTFDNFDNRTLDLHRLRHIVEPYANASLAGSTIEPGDLPVYDHGVEDLNEGLSLQLGMRHTLQTKRGGPGRWRSVDWLVLDTEVVLRGDDANNTTAIGRFFGYRPELGRGGDHVHGQALWMLTDSLALTGDATWDIERDSISQWRAGASFDHSPQLTSFATYHDIDPLDNQLFSYGFVYRLTRKYTVGFEHTLDFDRGREREIDLTLVRRLPRWRLALVARYDQVEDETTVGIVLTPEGLGGGGLP